MRLPKIAIDSHQFTVIFYVLLISLGISSFLTMPRTEDPQVSPPGTSIIVIYPGATPKDMEELVVNPIEEVLNELDDIKEIKSSMSDGLAIIGIEFITGSDASQKYSDVIQKVNGIESELPDQILSLEFQKWESSDVAIVQFAMISETASYEELQDEGERFKKLIEKVQNIKNVEVIAYPEEEIRISLDLERVSNFNIPLARIIQIIESENSNIPGGSVDLGKKKFNIMS